MPSECQVGHPPQFNHNQPADNEGLRFYSAAPCASRIDPYPVPSLHLVRRVLLCGTDVYAGKEFDHR